MSPNSTEQRCEKTSGEQVESRENSTASAEIHYAISTATGGIPYVIECDHPEFKQPRIVFLDHFLFKDSLYDRGLKASLAHFIGADTEISVAFENPTPCKSTRTLTSKRGNYKLTAEKYREVLDLMEVKTHADFKTGLLQIGGREVVEPRDLSEYVQGANVVFGTQIVNDLTAKGMLIYINGTALGCKHLNESDHEYEKYMLSINEMNAFTFIAEHNYRILYEFYHPPTAF